MIQTLKASINSSPALKKFIAWTIQPTFRPRPRKWIKWLINPWIHKTGKGSHICSSVRLDVFPFNHFSLGKNSTIEDFSCINNGMGDVVIGEKSRIGLSNTVIGPVEIGNNINMAQNIVISGLNHGYEDINIPIREQKCSTRKVTIKDGTWIGANVVIVAGVTVGKNSVIAAGAVVTKDVPNFTIVGGNPAKVLKQYDKKINQWI